MSGRAWALATASVLALTAALPAARADDLSAAYQQVLLNPADSEVNLQYAIVAEGNRKWRLALAAYERILANDPNNAAAKAGLQRVRRIIQPASTLVTTEAGSTYWTNPDEGPGSADPEFYLFGAVRVTDDRNLFGTHWRSNASLYGEYHFEQSDLSSIFGSVDTGPVYDLPGTLVDIHPAIGAAFGYFQGRYAYSEVNAAATIEGYLDGAMQRARVRGGYRQYDPSFTSDSGMFAGVDGRIAHKGFLGDRDVFSIAPWFMWSDIGGSSFNFDFDRVTPGSYTAGGARFEYDVMIAPHVTLGPYVQVGEWHYADFTPSGSRRKDLLVSPGVSLVFSDIFNLAQTSLRIDYRYDHNNSNDSAHDYNNQQVTVALVRRQ